MDMKTWIRESGRPRQHIAVELGIGRVALHRITTGETMPRPATVDRIVIATGGRVTAADLAATNATWRVGYA